MRGHLLASLIALLFMACAEPPSAPFCEPGVPCPAASPDHCAAGLEAKLHGRSAFADGTCVAKDDAACEASTVTCALFGQCSAPSSAAPASTPDACPKNADRDHLASRDPRCTRNTCIARDDDCKDARVCREEGRCLARDGVCVATEATCKTASLCRTLGWCTLSDPTGSARCRPTASDCLRSKRCQDFGDCGLRGERCAPCERSDGCRLEGLCALVDSPSPACRATDPGHCRASEACKREGRCRQHQGRCER
jgi:hypothetical protein